MRQVKAALLPLEDYPLNNIELDKLTRASIDLAQAASDYGALKVMFGVSVTIFLVLIIFFIAWQIMFLRRFKVIEEMCRESFKFFSQLNDHTIGKEEAKMIIRESLSRSEALMKYYILKIRLENHLDDKESTQGKITKIVDNDFTNRKAFLSKFTCFGHTVSFTAVEDDNEAVTKMLSAWVYKQEREFTVSLMAQEVSLYYDGLKTKAAMKIDGMPEA